MEPYFLPTSASICALCPKEPNEPCLMNTPLPFPSFNPSCDRKALQIHVPLMFLRIPDMGGHDPGSFLKLLQGSPCRQAKHRPSSTRLPGLGICYYFWRIPYQASLLGRAESRSSQKVPLLILRQDLPFQSWLGS